jgi:hypothetical protein
MERNGELILVPHGDDLVLDGRENLYVFACALYERGSDERHRDFSDSFEIFFGVKTPELSTVGVALYGNGCCRKIRMTVVAQFLGK